MNLKQAKALRQYVRETYPFMSDAPIYETSPLGVRKLAVICKRAFVQNIKKNIKRSRKDAG